MWPVGGAFSSFTFFFSDTRTRNITCSETERGLHKNAARLLVLLGTRCRRARGGAAAAIPATCKRLKRSGEAERDFGVLSEPPRVRRGGVS